MRATAVTILLWHLNMLKGLFYSLASDIRICSQSCLHYNCIYAYKVAITLKLVDNDWAIKKLGLARP